MSSPDGKCELPDSAELVARERADAQQREWERWERHRRLTVLTLDRLIAELTQCMTTVQAMRDWMSMDWPQSPASVPNGRADAIEPLPRDWLFTWRQQMAELQAMELMSNPVATKEG